ncbi:uncharacterized protein [Nicotiana sylvestris]|uniref:uncharacterized protein n=1 Tax=Nicotiana sylvestris TaxID=4096 RepID=UPI00388CB259
MVVPKAKASLPRPPPPYPQRLAKQNNENHFKKFIDMMKSLSINAPLVEALEQMPGYAKFMKDLVRKKRSMNCETIKMIHQVSAIVYSTALNLEDPSAFTISNTIGSADLAKALCDLGVDKFILSANFVILDYKVDYEVDKFILPADFVFLDCKVNYKVPIILGRPFLATWKDLVDLEAVELTFRVGDEKVVFHVCKLMRQSNSNEVCSYVDLVTEVIVEDTSAVINVEDALEVVLLNHDMTEDKGLVKYVNALQEMGSYIYKPRKLSLDLENRKAPPTKPSIEEPPVLELKPLPSHLRYEFLGICSTLHVILFSCLTNVQVDATLAVLQRRKKAIRWTLDDIR